MSILANAVDSLELGLEDFRANDSKRLLSAVRNIFAGVLLVFKHKLAELSKGSDEALLKEKVLPELVKGSIKWRGKGKKTVDFRQIRERFDSLGITVDWKRLEAVQAYRNDTEHYYDTRSLRPEVVREYILDCFTIACNFMRSELNVDPQSLFDSITWQSWMEEQEIFRAEERACSELLDRIDWSTDAADRRVREAHCPECSSSLIKPALPIAGHARAQPFQCGACGQEWGYEEMVMMACEQAKSVGDYFVHHDGADPEIVECPECGETAFDVTEDQCASCGATGPYECGRCGATIIPEELTISGGEYCAWCAHMLSRDD